MKHLRFLWFVLLPLTGLAATPGIEFTALVVSSGQPVARHMDKSAGASRWVRVGESFAGYTMSSVDGATDTVTLTREDSVLRLKLIKDAKVKNAPAPDTVELERLKSQRTELSRRYAERHPTMIEINNRIAALERKLAEAGGKQP